MSSLVKLIVIGLSLVFGIALFRALFMFKPAPESESCQNTPDHRRISLDRDPKILERFVGALNVPTVSYKPHHYESDQLLRLINFIEKNYPNIHSSKLVKRDIISNYSLVYEVSGSQPTLRPYLLTSHLDVVPAIRSRWSSEPFKAVIKDDGYIYGRGTIDAKHLTVAILEALEFLLGEGFAPRRTIFLAFGHDEEVLGEEGAQVFARLIKERTRSHDKLEYIIDEGLVISKTHFPGVPRDIALIGVAEKGYISLNISTVGQVGHGSMPHPKTAISKLADVVSRFHSTCMPSQFGTGIERQMFDSLANYAEWPMKFVYSNFWLFKPVLEAVFSQNPALNGLIRTSTAVTVIEGGTKENMLPDSASAVINHRVHQSETVAEVLQLVRRIINDPTIDVKVNFELEPSPIAPYDDNAHGYQLIRRSLLQIHPGAVVVPSIFLATTDSKWYHNLTDSIYRFSAIAVDLSEMKSFHGHDERLSVDNYEKLINFYHHLILNSDEPNIDLKQHQREDL